MAIKTVAPTKQQVDELRNMFIEKYEKNPPAVPFHPVDIDRVRNDDVWCTRFLEMYDLDMNVSFEKLWSTCIWRQQYGANDLNENNVRIDYLTDGVIFQHNKDIDGKPLLIFKTKLHVKGAKNMDDVLKVLVYWIERMHRETHMDKCTIFFDMEGTGLSNMDLDFIKMIIETFKMYYPNALNYIIVYEMAWVLNAAFKIVKALLPEKAVEILKVIKKKDINQYIDKDNCLTCWGGNDDYQFTFVPEKKTSAPAPNGKLPTESAPAVANDDFNNNVNDKKVHFAKSSLQQTPAAEKQTQMHDIPDHFTPQDHDMMRVSPQDFLKFSRGEAKESILELTSTSLYPVTYKIQTTSPEKFRVRPRLGILNPGETIQVNILLKPEHNLSESAKDKFLIMCLPAVDVQSNQNVDFWKKLDNNTTNIEQHRLCCIYSDNEMMPNTTMVSNGYNASSGDKKVKSSTQLSEETQRLEKQLRNTEILQRVTLIIVIILSVAVFYLLKLQLCNEDGCFSKDEAASNNVDFGSCAKGKADL
ncbi:motile sperm domain-containing protein 2-like [Lucilia cuprina]|uniref:motile sperm domain-containing protein 2-like n=1 Tax=Lucilia cuprina TaxID=7375 RepID=UPI001F05833C|nr:motile sperm domain-containing protein 2-like [Lucilia cuprina]